MRSKPLGVALLVTLVGGVSFHSASIAQNGLPPIHESSASNPVSNPVSNMAPPPPEFSQRQLSMEQRLTRLERLVDNQALIEMLTRLDELQAEVQSIRGELEVQRHQFDGIKQRQRDLYLDIDRRIMQLERSASAETVRETPSQSNASSVSSPSPTPALPALGGGSGPAPVVAAPVAATTVDPLKEQSAYQQALNVLREGRYDEAIVAFQSFLSRFQGSQYAGNAQYWIGEANYVSRRYPEAINEFQKVLDGYPDSSKVPDAMLKIGYTHYELKAWDPARQMLSSLVQRFPKTTAAQLADNRLHRMKLEGH